MLTDERVIREVAVTLPISVLFPKEEQWKVSRDIGPKSNIQAQRFRSIVRSKFSEPRVGYSDEEITSEKEKNTMRS